MADGQPQPGSGSRLTENHCVGVRAGVSGRAARAGLSAWDCRQAVSANRPLVRAVVGLIKPADRSREGL